MRGTCSSLLLSSILLPLAVSSLPTHSFGPRANADLPGTFVEFEELAQCPVLSKRDTPTSAKDVRPDDIRVVMALGDSITAGLLARPASSPLFPTNTTFFQTVDVEEYRGISYPMGTDEGAITIPNILSHFVTDNATVQGGAKGHHAPATSALIAQDGLNAAVSGATSSLLTSQVTTYIVPKLAALGLPGDDDWVYANVAIGANDICDFCVAPNVSIAGVGTLGSSTAFANDIRTAVNLLRKHTPKLIVNIIGILPVSAVYNLTLTNSYCQPAILSDVPHLPLECACALTPGPIGDVTRQRMDSTGEAYDNAVLEIVKAWEAEDDDGFGVMWQPGSLIDLENYPIEALSPVDCFHPSEALHRRVAAGIWNRLTLSLEEKYTKILWDDGPQVRCLEEDDRFQVNSVSQSS
ncbi:hypothetical protein I350_02222 [Cryptococcus amylolentus CBS 6273]|uniref:SGNH hydrolase-type esterase domain-containing protein n=1 Tax=Cryptococcus amylolentus CBS 6273 TaxID=1296118 RepID=A0A1E3K9Z8_9TREE|nr:hypothetical protein I350_02222 [Cryptococcus amylolentus CBS 6273]